MSKPIERGKFLIITDVHAKIKEMNAFFDWILDEKQEEIQYAVHLGDFWGGRNYNGKEQVRMKLNLSEKDYFENFRIPIFHIKGNEDLHVDNLDWLTSRTWLMRDQEVFQLGPYQVFPIHYHEKENPEELVLKHPEYSEKQGIDFIFTHQPAYGLLDNTLHAKTHQILKGIGSPMIRTYYDNIKPSILFFGHNHYSNYMKTDYGLVLSIDKLIRISKNRQVYKYSYALIDPFFQTLEVVWKNKLFLKYSILEKDIKYSRDLDQRNL